ncbi:tetratricopeptide repeat-containing sensor histidine kinase [Hymenobacter sp. BT175]|nr:tetratricopeptide repeat-containing sensor histidine kinase [Hymenobacter translucens]
MSKLCWGSLLLLVGSLLLSFPLRAQKPADAPRMLRRLRTLSTDTNRVRLLDSLCYALRASNPVTALPYGEQAVSLARRLGDERGLIRALNSLGSCYTDLSDGPHALALFDQALKRARRLNDSGGLMRNYISMGAVHHERNDTVLTWRNYRQALALIGKPGVTVTMETMLYGNLSSLYFYLERFPQALRYTYKALALARSSGDRLGEALYLANLGTYYLETENYPEAEKLLREALQITRDIKHPRYEAGNLELLAIAFKFQGKLDQAIAYNLQALRLARQANSLERVLDAYHGLSENAVAQGNYRQAYQWQQRYLDLNDTLNSRQRLNTLTALQTRYETLDKERQIRMLTRNDQQQRLHNQQLWVAVALLLLGLTAAGLFYWQLRRSRTALALNHAALTKATTELRQLTASKDRLYAIIAHDLRGPVTSFAGVTELIDFYVRQKDEEGLRRLPQLVRQSAQSLNGLLDNLLGWAVSQTGELAMHPEKLSVGLLFAEMAALYQSTTEAKQVTLSAACPPGLSVVADQNMIRTILRNLVGNAIKFTPLGGEVQMQASADDQWVTFRISDTGPGLSPEQVAALLTSDGLPPTDALSGPRGGTGLGMVLCRAFVERHQGQLTIESTPGQGAAVVVQLPAAG